VALYTSTAEQLQNHRRVSHIPLDMWKGPHMLKGALTWLPVCNEFRRRRASTGGSHCPRYCYSVWLRHLVLLDKYGFRVSGTSVGELGPGDSIGIGLAALLSGAVQYVGLDIVPFSATANLPRILDDLVGLYARPEPIPGSEEFPLVRPRLDSYDFPADLVDRAGFHERAATIRDALGAGLDGNRVVNYRAPWTSPDDLARGSLDLIVSQAVLEHVDDLDNTYRAMSMWAKRGAYASHVIDFSAHHLAPRWNGHWAYSDWQWALVRGRREFLLNREPLSAHLRCARNAGFETLAVEASGSDDGLHRRELASRFQTLSDEDARTRGAVLILRKL
jgi:hypothetical protein